MNDDSRYYVNIYTNTDELPFNVCHKHMLEIADSTEPSDWGYYEMCPEMKLICDKCREEDGQ